MYAEEEEQCLAAAVASGDNTKPEVTKEVTKVNEKNFLWVNVLPFRKICVPLQSVWPEGISACKADHDK